MLLAQEERIFHRDERYPHTQHMPPAPSEEARTRLTDLANPENPLAKVQGNEQARKRLCHAAFTALGRYNHVCNDVAFLLTGPKGDYKEEIARRFAELLRLPFIEINSARIKTAHDVFIEISSGLQRARLPLVECKGQGRYVLPPCVIFLDDCDGLKQKPKVWTLVFLAVAIFHDPKLRTEQGVHVHTNQATWLLATTNRAELTDGVPDRFTELALTDGQAASQRRSESVSQPTQQTPPSPAPHPASGASQVLPRIFVCPKCNATLPAPGPTVTVQVCHSCGERVPLPVELARRLDTPGASQAPAAPSVTHAGTVKMPTHYVDRRPACTDCEGTMTGKDTARCNNCGLEWRFLPSGKLAPADPKCCKFCGSTTIDLTNTPTVSVHCTNCGASWHWAQSGHWQTDIFPNEARLALGQPGPNWGPHPVQQPVVKSIHCLNADWSCPCGAINRVADGYWPENALITCSSCQRQFGFPEEWRQTGRSYTTPPPSQSPDEANSVPVVECPHCSSHGVLDGNECPLCRGAGRVYDNLAKEYSKQKKRFGRKWYQWSFDPNASDRDL